MLVMIKNAEESQRIKDLGEETQQEVRQLIVDTLGEEIPDLGEYIESAPMGAHGCDIRIHDNVRRYIPFNIECKQRSRGFGDVYKLHAEAIQHDSALGITGTIPALAFQQPDHRPMIVLDGQDFLDLHKEHVKLMKENKELKQNALLKTN